MAIQQSARDLLAQLSSAVAQLDEKDFTKPIPTLSNSSIGQHVRHTIEFFLCLMDGANKGEINYDNRKHDTFIQEDKKLAISVMDSIHTFLTKEISDHNIDLVANYSLKEDEDIVIPSSFYRELAYNIEHAIHHMALIKIGIREVAGYVDLPQHFGVASSTVRYQKNQS